MKKRSGEPFTDAQETTPRVSFFFFFSFVCHTHIDIHTCTSKQSSSSKWDDALNDVYDNDDLLRAQSISSFLYKKDPPSALPHG